MMIPAAIIRKKRDGHELSRDEIQFFVTGYYKNEIPDYQMSALLMAIVLKGMNTSETAALTHVMLHSGRTLQFSGLPFTIDKHSTGGIGDKTSLLIAPIIAACGLRIPMIAGRGLGHTGGTVDKLESIDGFNPLLSLETFQKQVETIGGAMTGQTADICPADKKIYGLRDVTGTVESLPLICASILSKKIAEGINGLVLDVKFGSGAFMKTLDDARELARWLVATGNNNKVKTRALLTNMEEPLGRFIGNGIEVLECVSLMTGNSYFDFSPKDFSDTKELTLRLCAEMLLLAGVQPSLESGYQQAEEVLASGKAYDKWCEIIKTQGGNPDRIAQPPLNGWQTVKAKTSGFLHSYDTEAIGYGAIALGAGRKVTSDVIDFRASIISHKKVGDAVATGDIVFSYWAATAEKFQAAESILETSFKISLQKPTKTSLILETVI